MPDAPSPKSREGEVLAGKYKLLSRLGTGGMGEVYRAENTLIGRTVAIKLLLPEHLAAQDLAARFLREARAAVIVHHPNVVDVLDIGEDPKAGPFIVQEILQGEDLDSYLRRNGERLTIPQLADLVFPVIDAVALAHSRGVVHRDLKPSNVFLSRFAGKTIPKLLDFGISQIKSGKDSIRMTGTGVILGSPAYMSPEQIEHSAKVDARSDVWSLGVILYEVLSGELPFKIGDGENVWQLFLQITSSDAPPLKQTAPNVSAELARIVDRCLKRDPAQRYANAGELLRDLVDSPLGASLPPAARTVEPPKVLEFRGSLQITKPDAPPPAKTAPAAVAGAAETKQPAARSRPLARPVMGDPIFSDGGRNDIDLDVRSMRAAAIRQARSDIRHQGPPPRRRRKQEQVHVEPRHEITKTSTVLFAGLFLGVSLVLLVVVRVPDGMMKALWSSPLLTGQVPVTTALAAGVMTVIGAAVAIEAVPAWEREWGWLLSAAGFVSTGLVLGYQAVERWSVTDPSLSGEVSSTLASTLSMIPMGLCVFATQKAWKHWRDGTPTGLLIGFALAPFFGLGAVVVNAILFGQ
jgi:serine/threonine protein kinase